MEYQVIKTKFGKDSIYVPFEKMLYISKGRPNEYICYQSVLSDKKKKGHESHLPCSARIRCLPNGKCERQNVYVQHTAHPNHERIGSDKQIMNEICRKAETLRIDHPHDAHRVPNRHIFQREVARYYIFCMSFAVDVCACSVRSTYEWLVIAYNLGFVFLTAAAFLRFVFVGV